MFSTSTEIVDRLPVISSKLTRLRKTDGWNRRFDKLPVISAKLSLHVTSADEAERDRWLESALRQTARDFRKAEFTCDRC